MKSAKGKERQALPMFLKMIEFLSPLYTYTCQGSWQKRCRLSVHRKKRGSKRRCICSEMKSFSKSIRDTDVPTSLTEEHADGRWECVGQRMSTNGKQRVTEGLRSVRKATWQ